MSKTFLYKADGTGKLIHGVKCVSIIVDASEVSQYESKGWYHSPEEAKENGIEELPFTRQDLEEKAKKFNIKFDKRTSDKSLLNLVTTKSKSLESK